MAITVKEAQTLYVSYFGRPADFVGLQYWTGTETLVGSLEQLAHSFYNSAEGKKYFPINPATQQIDITESINAIYANMFGRVPDTAGFEYWYNEIASGKINLAEAAVAIYKGAQGKDALMIENKIAAATQFTDQVAASGKPSLYYGDQAFAKANEFLSTVTDTTDVASAGFAAQVNAVVAAAEAIGGSSYEGLTFTLTDKNDYADAANSFHGAAADTFKFTNGNDVVEASNITLGSGDILTDQSIGDNDKLNLNLTSSFAADKDITISNIETINVFNNSAAVRSVDLSAAKITGVKTINVLGNNKLSLDVSTFADNVTINGGDAANTIVAGKGNDVINGGDADDKITAGEGNDTIIGGAGDNTYTGGKGADTFVVGSGSTDKITDFAVGSDILTVSEGGIANVDVAGHFTANGTNLVNDGSVSFNVIGSNIVLDLSQANGEKISSISVGAGSGNSGASAEIIATSSNDKISSYGTGANKITAGAGDDEITLNSTGKDIVIFEANADANGVDTINKFSAGSASGADVLNFAEFLDAEVGTGTTALLSSGIDLTNKNVGVVAKTGGTITNADIALVNSSAETGKISIKDNAKAVVLVVNAADTSTAGAVNIYYVQDTNAATDAQTWDVQLVGTIESNTSTSASGFVASNFA